ncbi:hypothetical protein Tco_1089722 [Tanacetum coccineum]
MYPLAPNYKRKTRADRGKKRPRESNASSSYTTQNHPFSSLPLDAIVDENDDESFHSNSSSLPSQNVSSSSNVNPRVIQNPPYESHYLNTHLSKTINLQTQQRDAHREGLRSLGQAIKNMMKGKRHLFELLDDLFKFYHLTNEINFIHFLLTRLIPQTRTSLNRASPTSPFSLFN